MIRFYCFCFFVGLPHHHIKYHHQYKANSGRTEHCAQQWDEQTDCYCFHKCKGTRVVSILVLNLRFLFANLAIISELSLYLYPHLE